MYLVCLLCGETRRHTSDASTPACHMPALADTDITPFTCHLLPLERRNLPNGGSQRYQEVVILRMIGLNLDGDNVQSTPL